MEEKNKATNIVGEGLEQVNGGALGRNVCPKYDPKPGKHLADGYGKCFTCIHEGNCEIRKKK